MDTIRHYANFPATGVSLRQMVQFGDKPSTGEALCPFPQSPELRVVEDQPSDTEWRRHSVPSLPVSG